MTSTTRFEAMVAARPAAIAAIADRARRLLAERQWPQDRVDAVELALREALANAIRHGCRGDVTQHVRCSISCDESDDVRLVVRDPGVGFDPDAVPDPCDEANALKPGGRGILLMRALMDEVEFGDGGREVRMRMRKASR